MSPAHIHLLITHLPIFGAFIGSLVLTYAIIIKSNDTKIAAYGVLILSTFGAGIAFLTGEGTEEIVEEIPGIVDSAIKTHENFALIALIGLLLLGLLSIIGLLAIFSVSLLLFVKPISLFFEFELLNTSQLLISIGVGFLSVVWFELVKWYKRKNMIYSQL
jgi:hypothetical protein